MNPSTTRTRAGERNGTSDPWELKLSGLGFLGSALLTAITIGSRGTNPASVGLQETVQSGAATYLYTCALVTALGALVLLRAAPSGAPRERAWFRALSGLLLIQSIANITVASGRGNGAALMGLPLLGVVLVAHVQRRARVKAHAFRDVRIESPRVLSIITWATVAGLVVGVIDVVAGFRSEPARILHGASGWIATVYALGSIVTLSIVLGLLLGVGQKVSSRVWSAVPSRDPLDRALLSAVPVIVGASVVAIWLPFYGTHHEIAFPTWIPTTSNGGPWLIAGLGLLVPLGLIRLDADGTPRLGFLADRTRAGSHRATCALLLVGASSLTGCALWIAFNETSLQLGNDSYARIVDCGLVLAALVGVLTIIGLWSRSTKTLGGRTEIPIALCGIVLSAWTALAPSYDASLATRSFELTWGATRLLRGLSDFDRDGYSSLFGDGDPAPFDATSSPATLAGLQDLHTRVSGKPYSGPADELRSRSDLPESTPNLRPKNLLLISVDALRARSMGLHGSARKTTPNLTRRAQGGAMFERCYAPASGTHSSLRALVGGHLQGRLHIYNGTSRKVEHAPSIFEAAIRGRSFDRFIIAANDDALPVRDRSLHEGVLRIDCEIESRQQFEIIENALLEGGPEQSFCVWAHLFDVHFPYVKQPDAPDYGDAMPDLYDGLIERFDRELERFLTRLESHGLLDDTLVVVTADHGVEFREHGVLYHGLQVYEESLHVPLVMLHPSLRSTRHDVRVSLMDLAPTFAELFRIDDADLRYEGTSLVPLLEGKSPPASFERDLVSISARQDAWSLIGADDWKLVYQRHLNSWELYHLPTDPEERRNRYLSDPERARDLTLRLLGYMIRGYERHGISHHWQPRYERRWN